ncbi:MAG: hypothetical protein AABX30_02970 [Nanoarchaeota archaeon]
MATAEGFLWHKVSEKEKLEIQKQAKQIMSEFSKALEKIDQKTKEPFVKRDKCERDESDNEKPLEIDKDIIFENAPNKNKDFIVAEKKGW